MSEVISLNISLNLFSSGVILLSQVSPLLASSDKASHFCTDWFGNLQETISAEERTFPIMSSLPHFSSLFFICLHRKPLSTWWTVMQSPAKMATIFLLHKTLKVRVKLFYDLTKHEFNGTKAHLAFNQPSGFTVTSAVGFLCMTVVCPSHRLLCCTPLDCKKDTVQLKLLRCACVHSQLFSIFNRLAC